MRLRKADLGDLGWLVKQLRAFDAFQGTKKSLFPESAEEAVSLLEGLIQAHPFIVAEDFAGPVGFIAGVLQPHPYNSQVKMLSELFWWVDPRYRGSTAGARLLEAFIEYGKRNADLVVMTLEEKSPVDPRSLERKGFRLYERNFMLEVEQTEVA